jgi:thymidylate kinase
LAVVEFLGLPGAGKSTMRREVIASMKEAGQSAVDLPTAMLAAIRLHGADRLTRAVAIVTRSGSSPAWRRAYARSTDRFTALTRFLAANPEVMEVVLATQRQRRGRDLHQERVLSWILSLMANTQLVDKTAGRFDWLFIDEGFCQRAIALFVVGFDDEDELRLRSYVAAIPLPEILVVVEASPSVCEARLDELEWSERVTEMNRAERRDFLNTAARVVELVADEADRLGARVIRIDGTAPIGESCDALTRALVI